MSKHIGMALCEALGLDSMKVREININCKAPGNVVNVTVRYNEEGKDPEFIDSFKKFELVLKEEVIEVKGILP